MYCKNNDIVIIHLLQLNSVTLNYYFRIARIYSV